MFSTFARCQAAYDASQQQRSWENTAYPGGCYFPNAIMYGRAPPGAPLWGPARPVDGFESVPYWAGARCPEYPSTPQAAYWQYQLKQRQYWEYAAMRRHSAPAVTGTPQPAPRNGDLPSVSPACGPPSATPAVASMGWQQYFAGTPASQLPFLKHVVAPVSRQGRPENFPVGHGLHGQPPSTSNAVPPWLTKSLQVRVRIEKLEYLPKYFFFGKTSAYASNAIRIKCFSPSKDYCAKNLISSLQYIYYRDILIIRRVRYNILV
jgi:hypothetical protein